MESSCFANTVSPDYRTEHMLKILLRSVDIMKLPESPFNYVLRKSNGVNVEKGIGSFIVHVLDIVNVNGKLKSLS